MADVTVTLNVPAGDGFGTITDVSAMGVNKTVIVTGIFTGVLFVQASANGVDFIDLATFTDANKQVVQAACTHLRVRRGGTSGGALPTCDVAADAAGAQAASVVVPAGTGVGAAVDISAFGTYTTVILTGSFGGVVIVQLSEDNVDWVDANSFSAPSISSSLVTAGFVRARSVGVTGTPVLAVSAVNDPASAATPVTTFVYRPGTSPNAPNVYNDWATMIAAIALVEGTRAILIDDSVVSPTQVPAGVWDISNCQFFSFAQRFTPTSPHLEILEGASFTFTAEDLVVFGLTLHTIFSGVTSPFALTNLQAILIQDGAVMESPGLAAPMISTALAPGEIAVLGISRGATLGNGSTSVATNPSVGAVLVTVNESGTIETNAVSSAAGAIVFLIDQDSSCTTHASQPNILGTLSTDSTERNHWFPQPPFAGPAALVFDDGGKTIKGDTTGGAFAITLPPAADIFPGTSIWVIHTVGAALLSVAPDGADTINGGAASIPIPTVGGSLQFLRDNVAGNWLVLGAGA